MRCSSVKVSSLWTRRSACTQHRPCWPTLNWPASSLTMTVLGRKPCALMLPHRAPSVAKDATQPDFLTNLFRQTAVRYVLMAEDLERSPDCRRGMGQGGLSTSLKARADSFLVEGS